jgi:hypothetical protein
MQPCEATLLNQTQPQVYPKAQEFVQLWLEASKYPTRSSSEDSKPQVAPSEK